MFVWTVSGVIDTIALAIVLIGLLVVGCVYAVSWITDMVLRLRCKVGWHKYVTVKGHRCHHHRVWADKDNSMCSACIPPHEQCKNCAKDKEA